MKLRVNNEVDIVGKYHFARFCRRYSCLNKYGLFLTDRFRYMATFAKPGKMNIYPGDICAQN